MHTQLQLLVAHTDTPPATPTPTPTDAELHGDDFGLDLTDLSGITGFLMNEVPDNLGHFYPPWANDPAPTVKDEPFMMPDPVATAARPQQQAQLPSPEPLPAVAPVADPALDVVMGGTAGGGATVSTTRLPPKPAKAARAGAASSAGIAGAGARVGATFRKTAAGGVNRRRSSSKEEQAKKRRERNRVLARRTRLRKKFFFQSLQQQVRSYFVNVCAVRCVGICRSSFLFSRPTSTTQSPPLACKTHKKEGEGAESCCRLHRSSLEISRRRFCFQFLGLSEQYRSQRMPRLAPLFR